MHPCALDMALHLCTSQPPACSTKVIPDVVRGREMLKPSGICGITTAPMASI